jgi:hypothetical protein
VCYTRPLFRRLIRRRFIRRRLIGLALIGGPLILQRRRSDLQFLFTSAVDQRLLVDRRRRLSVR